MIINALKLLIITNYLIKKKLGKRKPIKNFCFFSPLFPKKENVFWLTFRERADAAVFNLCSAEMSYQKHIFLAGLVGQFEKIIVTT